MLELLLRTPYVRGRFYRLDSKIFHRICQSHSPFCLKGRLIRRPDSGSGRLPPGRRGRGLGEAGVLPSEAVASSAAEDVDDAPPLASIGPRYPSRWRMHVRRRRRSMRVRRGSLATPSPISILRAGVEAHSSAPPTRPYVDIDGADATLDVARSIVARDPR